MHVSAPITAGPTADAIDEPVNGQPLGPHGAVDKDDAKGDG